MNEIKDGGPAFPCDEQIRDSMIYQPEPGMTLRDYMAAKAMQGICAHPDTWGLRIHEITEHAYDIADAMLRARGQS